MWHCGPAKQRLWLGAGRYPCRCPRARADANAYRNADGDTDSYTYAVQLVGGSEHAYSIGQIGGGLLPG
jgi:hypothetical protein